MEKFAFFKSAAGMIRQANSAEAYTYERGTDGIFRGVGVALGENGATEQVTLTGWACIRTGKNTMYQTTTGEYIDLNEGWSLAGNATLYSQSQAQSLVNKIIRNNARILENNLICARFAHKLTSAQQKQLYNLQARLNSRNEELLNGGLVTPKTQASPEGYAELQSYLDSFMSRGGVGSLTVAIVISAIVVASLATAAYFCYRYYASESEQDVKFSDELTKTLTSKLTEEEYEQLLSETRGIVTKAKIRQRFKSSTRWLIVSAVAIGAGFLLSKFKTIS